MDLLHVVDWWSSGKVEPAADSCGSGELSSAGLANWPEVLQATASEELEPPPA